MRDVVAQRGKAAVDLLDAVPLAQVAPLHLGRLHRRHGVPEGRVEGDLLPAAVRRAARHEELIGAAKKSMIEKNQTPVLRLSEQ